MKAYHVDVSLKDAGKTLAGIKLISACFIIVQKENKGRNTSYCQLMYKSIK